MQTSPVDARRGRAFALPARRETLRWAVASLLVALGLGSATLAPTAGPEDSRPEAEPPPPRNVIFMIGDGLGPSHVTLARDVAGRPLTLDSLLVGAITTASADSRVTDSGAAGSALACGVRTYNAAISVDSSGTPHRTLLEAAESRDMATGLVVTSRITHATPASFAAHAARRSVEDSIAAQMLDQDIEVLLGGGRRHFQPRQRGGHRSDGRDLLEALRARGAEVVTDRPGLMSAGEGPLVGLFSDSHLSYEVDRDTTREPSLLEMTRIAVDRLSAHPGGFFLVVEGSRIDHAGHVNDPATVAGEVLHFDATVQFVLDYARRDRVTLVVVTADHETGGLSVGCDVGGRVLYDWHPEVLRGVRRSASLMADKIEAGMDPRVVLGEDAGLQSLGDSELKLIRKSRGDDRAAAIGQAVSRRARVGWTTRGHTAVDVPVWAFGPGAERLRGVRSNDALGRLVGEILGLEVGGPVPGER